MKLLKQKFKIASINHLNLKNIFKKTKVYFFLIFASFTLSSCVSFNDLIGKNTLELNDFQIEKFREYLNGRFYSNELKKISPYNKPMLFAVSKNGKSSLIIACYYQGNPCDLGVFGYQSLRKYSKKLGNELFIFALENRIVWNGSNIFIKRYFYESDDILELKNEIIQKGIAKINNNVPKSELNNFSLLRLPEDSCNSDDC